MSIKARFALNDLIAKWSEEFELTPEQEIELLRKQLEICEQAALVAAMGYDPEREVEDI